MKRTDTIILILLWSFQLADSNCLINVAPGPLNLAGDACLTLSSSSHYYLLMHHVIGLAAVIVYNK